MPYHVSSLPARLAGGPRPIWQVPARQRDFSITVLLVTTIKTLRRHKYNFVLSRLRRKVDKPAKAFLGTAQTGYSLEVLGRSSVLRALATIIKSSAVHDDAGLREAGKGSKAHRIRLRSSALTSHSAHPTGCEIDKTWRCGRLYWPLAYSLALSKL